jgi:urease accessory protein
MERVHTHLPAGHWPDERSSDCLTLVFDQRHRRRLRLVTDSGTPLLLDLPRTTVLCHGDGLRTEAGIWIQVAAAEEPLLEVTARDAHHLTRLAWHVGNRHVAAEIGAGSLRIRPDHVIAAMLEGLGGQVKELVAPFQPEGGAYAGHEDHDH